MAVSTDVSKVFVQHCTLDMLRDEAVQLVQQGLVSQQQPIYALCCHIPPREWPYLEAVLEQNSYLLRDRIVDLIGTQAWQED